MGYQIDPADEEFNLLFREGGGYPVDDNTGDRDCISQMGLAEHSHRVLKNAMRDLRLQVCDSERVETCCSGGDLFERSHTIDPVNEPPETPMLSLDRRFMIRVPREQRLISKQLQNLSAIALMLLT